MILPKFALICLLFQAKFPRSSRMQAPEAEAQKPAKLSPVFLKSTVFPCTSRYRYRTWYCRQYLYNTW